MHRIARPANVLASRRVRLSMLPSQRMPYATAPKPPSTTSQFYRTFTRPIAKVLVLAVFTYQFIYWGWAKLEADEHRQKTDEEIADLEAQARALDKARKVKTDEKLEEKPGKRWWWW